MHSEIYREYCIFQLEDGVYALVGLFGCEIDKFICIVSSTAVYFNMKIGGFYYMILGLQPIVSPIYFNREASGVSAGTE